MFHIVLVEPEIPPNTGNIIRLSANCGSQLHLIKPLGFDLTDKRLRRAGLDYHDLAHVTIHDSLQAFFAAVTPQRYFACSTKGRVNFNEVKYQPGDTFIFGPETRGLSSDFLATMAEDAIIRIPMLKGSRSLNLSNAAAIIVYEAWRQNGFALPDTDQPAK
ncbi:MAG: tRNA (uridine(34)/cytosine(34)/5-carboxymethylaminomethyluridine(34)-2'-O)-methyltransferase TrmL [Gammaproteobacteria bacterium]